MNKLNWERALVEGLAGGAAWYILGTCARSCSPSRQRWPWPKDLGLPGPGIPVDCAGASAATDGKQLVAEAFSLFGSETHKIYTRYINLHCQLILNTPGLAGFWRDPQRQGRTAVSSPSRAGKPRKLV